MGWWSPLLCLLALPACRWECPGYTAWDDLEVAVEEPGDEEQVETQHWASLALAEFARWSGRNEICVTSVEVVEEAGEDTGIAGSWNSWSGEIQLDDQQPDPWEATTHELCHAADERGTISEAHPDLFPPEDVAHSRYYWTKAARTREAFALVCEAGAVDVGIWRAWRDDCPAGWPQHDPEPIALVQEEVFPLAERIPWEAPTVHLEVGTPWAAPEVGEGWYLWSPLASPQYVVLPYVRQEDRALRVAFAEPSDGTIVASWEFDPCGGAESCSRGLVQGLGGPWLYVSRDQGEAWWRVSEKGPDPVAGACEWSGWGVVGGTAWQPLPTSDGQVEVQGCELASGVIVQPPAHTPAYPLVTAYVEADHAPRTLVVASGGPVWWWRNFGLSWWDVEAQTWRDVALPVHLQVADVVPLPDGRLLLGIRRVKGDLLTDGSTLAWLEPATGAFSAPDDPCPVIGDFRMGRRLVAGDGWALLWRGWDLCGPESSFQPFAFE